MTPEMDYLGRHDAVVALDAVRRLAKAAAGLDKDAGAGDADSLDQRLPHRLLRWHEDGVERVVSHSLPDVRVVDHYWNTELLELLPRPDSAQMQQLRAADGPRRQNHLAPTPSVQVSLVAFAGIVLELHAHCRRPLPPPLWR